MARTRILYLDAQQLQALAAAPRGALAQEGVFAADEAGLARFTEYLRTHRRALFRLVVDVSEEAFLQDRIPALSGADREALIDRRATQALAGSPYRTAESLGRLQGEPRRDEEILIFGIHRATLLEPWLKALADAGVALAGMHSLAQCGPLLLKALSSPPPPRALIILRTPAGLRHVYLESGKLRFSRQIPRFASETAQQDWLDEADKTRQYLIRERNLNRSDTLAVFLLGHEGVLPTATPPAFSVQPIDEAALAKRLRVRAEGRNPSFHLALAALLQKPPKAQLAPREARFFYTARRARSALYVLASVAGLTCTSLAVAWLNEAANIDRAIPRKTAPAPLPEANPQLPKLRALLASIDQLKARSPGPEPLLALLSQALEQHPEVTLTALDWQAQKNAQGFAATLSIEGHLAAQPTDLRSQLDQVHRFHATLQRLTSPGVEASLTRLPVDVKPTNTLRSQETEADTPAGFSLTLTQPL